VAKLFESQRDGIHIYDEEEQGQPAFKFERKSGAGTLSFVATECGGGRADPDWQNVPFHAEECNRQYDELGLSFLVKYIEKR
jgi:hypothetical protein